MLQEVSKKANYEFLERIPTENTEENWGERKRGGRGLGKKPCIIDSRVTHNKVGGIFFKHAPCHQINFFSTDIKLEASDQGKHGLFVKTESYDYIVFMYSQTAVFLFLNLSLIKKQKLRQNKVLLQVN